jgi:CRISPR-associated protein Cas1
MPTLYLNGHDSEARLHNRGLEVTRPNAAKDKDQVDVCNSLQALSEKAATASSLDSLRGCEGMAAGFYFRQLGAYFPDEIPFASRNRRPPRDEANALMSWTYTIVMGEVDAAVRTAGLDACLGCLHGISYGRPSLSLDLLEPLRAPLCDMLTLRLLNHKLLKKEHFEFPELSQTVTWVNNIFWG